jgi:hypothetical protein
MAALSACVILGAALAACGSAQASRQPAVSHQRAVPATTPVAPSTTVAPTPTTAPAPTAVSIPPVPGWSPPLTTIPPGGGITSVACISDTFCISAGGGDNHADSTDTSGAGLTQSWDGETWSDPSTYFPAPTAPNGDWPLMPAVACTSGPFCVVADGSGAVSNGDGTNWITPVGLPSAPTLPANPADPGPGHAGSRTTAVSCPSPSFCAIVENTGTVYTWRHGAWLTPQAFGAPDGPGGSTTALYAPGRVGLSCPTATACTAVVGTAVLDWDGTQWSEESAPWSIAADPRGVAVACPTATLCAIVSGPVMAFRNGTATWSAPRAIDPGGQLDGISCPTTSFCMAVDAGGSAVSFDGSTWAPPVKVLPPATEYTGIGTSVACTSDQFCMVLNGDGDYTAFNPPMPGSESPTATTSPTTTTVPG